MSKTTKTTSSIQKNNRNNKHIDQEKNKKYAPKKALNKNKTASYTIKNGELKNKGIKIEKTRNESS